ncbi:MAG: hypothetical protein L7F78_15735, partial [Syntrophales bacterium LBB04]|nr:hypothetical protein [Syntrophales bacterium LBB04]
GQDLRELFTELGLSAAETPEIECFKLFNYATATTYHTCNDGLALGSAVHKRLDGTTFSNLATSSDATYTSFWSNVISAENQYDHRQKRIKAKVRGVLASPVMEKQFREILYSKDRPDTANRAVNAMVQSGRHFELWLSPYITDTDMWALLMEAPLNDLIFFWRRRTRFAKEPDFETGDLRAKCDQRFSLEVGDCRSTYLNVP